MPGASTPKIAVLDDYSDVARSYADWTRFGDAVTVYHDHVYDLDGIVERLAPFDVVCVMRERTQFPRELIARLPNLKLLVTAGMVNRGIDLAACTEHGVVVCGTDSGAGVVADVAWALIMALAYRIVAVDRDLRAGRWETGINEGFTGKTLGIVGLGRSGAKVAKFAQTFGMPAIAWSQNLTPERAAECGVELVSKDELFRRADVVTVHLVLSARSRGIIGARELALMRPTAFLVNTSRGPIVDEAALLDALASGRIAGAGLDVYDIEPLPVDHPLRRVPNTVLTPHIGYVTQASFRVFYPQMIEDIEAWMRGTPLRVLTT